MLDRRVEILKYFKDEYTKTRQTPTVRSMCRRFGLNNKKFYEVFSEGIAELCKETGIPIPEAKYKRIEKAAAAKMEIKKESNRLVEEDREFLDLKQKELVLEKEVNHFRMLQEKRKRIKTLYLEKARTSEGVKDVFSTPEKLLEFTQATVGNYRSVVLKNPDVLESLVVYCRNNNLPLAKTLSQIAGSFKEYEADAANDGTLLDLDNYVGLQLDFFLGDRQDEDRIRGIQKKFADNIYSVKCPDCGTKYENMIIDTLKCELVCSCGVCFKLLCLNCRAELGFDSEKGVFCCPKCHMVFKRPSQKLRYASSGGLRNL